MTMGHGGHRIKTALEELGIPRSRVKVEIIYNRTTQYDPQLGRNRRTSEPIYTIGHPKGPAEEKIIADNAQHLADQGFFVSIITRTCECLTSAGISTQRSGVTRECLEPSEAHLTNDCPSGPYGARIAEIAQVLTDCTLHGACEGPADEIARAWALRDFDADDVRAWLAAGCTDPYTARALAEAGVTADRAADTVTVTVPDGTENPRTITGQLGSLAASRDIVSPDFPLYASPPGDGATAMHERLSASPYAYYRRREVGPFAALVTARITRTYERNFDVDQWLERILGDPAPMSDPSPTLTGTTTTQESDMADTAWTKISATEWQREALGETWRLIKHGDRWWRLRGKAMGATLPGATLPAAMENADRRIEFIRQDRQSGPGDQGRNVISTNAGLDVTEAYSDAVREILDGATGPGADLITARTTHQGFDYRVRVVSYAAPDTGREMWAVDYSDPASREVEECADRDAAEARYEEMVRAAQQGAAHLDHGDEDGELFDFSDVAGVDARETGGVCVSCGTAQDIAAQMDDEAGHAVWLCPSCHGGDPPEIEVIWSVVRGESPGARAVGPEEVEGLEVPGEILAWAEENGLLTQDPDVYLMLTPAALAGEVPGEIAWKGGTIPAAHRADLDRAVGA